MTITRSHLVQRSSHPEDEVQKMVIRTKLKLLSVLIYRNQITNDIIATFLELIFLRDNLAAHDTGQVDSEKRRVEKTDVYFLVELIEQVFK